MLSIENPPHPSCSSRKAPTALKSDERAPPLAERLAFSDQADPAAAAPPLGETHPPLFCIRDYVFTSRSKEDIGANWPFPRRYLQLCLKHGVQDLLPPFEPPDSVRARLIGAKGGGGSSEHHPVVCSEGREEATRPEVDLVESSPFDPANGESEPPIKYDSCLPTDKSVLGSWDQFQNPLSEESKLPIVGGVGSNGEPTHGGTENASSSSSSTVTSNSRRRDQIGTIPSPVVGGFLQSVQQETRSISESSTGGGEFAGTPQSSEEENKKCRLIVKLGTVSEPSRTEDVVVVVLSNNSSSVSDPMAASKVCPVCKTFSSTSNTTLNAHIDRCLSVETSTKRVAATNKVPRPKVKSKKKRFMVDICATAPRCTLEDLDRRNGSNWALDLTWVAPAAGEACTAGTKRPRLSPVNPIDDESEGGAVYVDSNGTKLRILSRFSDAQQPAAAAAAAVEEDREPTRFRKMIQDGKRFSFGKKKHLSPNYMKYMKVKPQSKKLSFNPSKREIHTASEEKFQMDADQEKNDSISQTSTAREQIKGSEPATLKQWVCSKRSGLSKKINKVVSRSSPRNPEAMTCSPLTETNQSVSGDSSPPRSHIFKSSMPSVDFTSSSKIKSVDILSNTVHGTECREKHSRPLENSRRPMGNTSSTSKGLTLKLSRSSGNYAPSPRSKGLELHASVKNLPLRMSENFHPLPPKAKRSSTLRKNLSRKRPSFSVEASECNEVEKGLIYKKLRKCRSVEKTGRRGGKSPSDVNERFHDSPRVSDLGSARNNRTSRTCQSNLSENIMGLDALDIVNQVSPRPSNTLDIEQGKESCHVMKSTDIMEGGRCFTLKQLQPVPECHLPELMNVNSQVEVSANVGTMIKTSLEKAVSSPVTGDTGASSAATFTKLNPYPSLEEHIDPICNTEAFMDPRIPKLVNDQGLDGGGEATDQIGGQNIQMAGQIEHREKDDSCSELQNTECRADTASAQGSSFCLTSPGDSILEVLHENSSVTSVRIVPTQDYYMEIDGEPSESPVSTASTISHPSMEDVKTKDSEPGPPAECVAVPDNLRPDYSSGLAVPPFAVLRETETANFEKRSQELNVTAQVRDPENVLDKQPCCCSRRESISWDSQPFSQSIMAGMTLPSKAKQMASNLFIRPVMMSPLLSTCSILRTEEVALPISNSHTDAVWLNASSDAAVRFPTCTDFAVASPSYQTQSQSTSSPVLRLMGKNLLVNKKEEEPVLPQKQVVPCSSTDTPNAYLSFLGFSSTCSVSNQGSPLYRPRQFLEDSMLARQASSNAHQVPPTPPTMWIDSFGRMPLHNGLKNKTDFQDHQKGLKPSSPIAGKLEKVSFPRQRQKPISAARAPAPPREVIVIDDSPELEVELKGSLPSPASTLPPAFSGCSNLRPVRPFACFPPPNPFQLRELSTGQMHGFPILCPRVVVNANNSTKRGSASEASPGPPLSNPLTVPCLSPGQLTPTLYCSSSLRGTHL